MSTEFLKKATRICPLHTRDRDDVPCSSCKSLAKLLEIIQDFLNNEVCSCLKLGQHPCSRCQVTIDEARSVLNAR